MSVVGVPNIAGGHDARPRARPLFLCGVLRVDEEVEDEVLRVVGEFLDGGDGVVLQKSREVEEVDVLAVGVEDRVGGPFQGGRLNKGYRSLREAGAESCSAVVVLLRGYPGCYCIQNLVAVKTTKGLVIS